MSELAKPLTAADGAVQPTETAHLLPTAIQPEIAGWRWELGEVDVILVGCGSIGRALAVALISLGARTFTLIDPKRYRSSSIASQCRPEDVGRRKVAVVAEELRELGATVRVCDRSLGEVEPGLVAPAADRKGIVVAAVDRLRGQLEAVALAQLLHAPLLRVNLEADALLSTVRCFDFGFAYERCHESGEAEFDLCPLCNWSPEMIADQESEYSCDREALESASADRSTQSPRALSGLTASWAALMAAGLLASDANRSRWHGKEWLFSPLGPVLQEGSIAENPECVGDHSVAPTPLRVGPAASVSLADLAELAGFDCDASADLFVTGSGTRVRKVACASCKAEQGSPRWVGVEQVDSLRGGCGSCPTCGRELLPAAGHRASALRAGELDGVWHADLAHWGVPDGALVTLTVAGPEGAERRQDFLVGEEAAQ